jgi:hypothetical protein
MSRLAVALGVIVLVCATARAQPYDDPETEEALRALDPNAPKPPTGDPPPTDERTPVEVVAGPKLVPAVRPKSGIALKRGGLTVTLTLEASLSKDSEFEPASIAPDISYGVADGVTLSVVHSGFATTGFRGGFGPGVCVTGTDGGCAKVYNNAGVEALVDIVRGDFALAGLAGVHALSFDPQFIDAKVGLQSLVRAGKVTVTFNPSVFVGITERDAGNKGGLFFPASLGVAIAKPVFAAVGTGFAGPIDSFGDGWSYRLGFLLRYRIAKPLFVAASLTFPKVAGGDAVTGTGFDARTLNFWFTYSQ